MAASTPASEVDWLVTVEEPMPDCPDCQAAFAKIASPSKYGDWRSSLVAKAKVTIVPPAVEPMKTDDEMKSRFGCITSSATVVESKSTEDDCVFDIFGQCCCGLAKGRLRFEIYKKDGVVTGKVQEKQYGCSCLLPPKGTVEKEHRTMLKELNDTFKSTSS